MIEGFWKTIDPESPMFDFKDFYEQIAARMPDQPKMAEVGLANGKSFLFLGEAMVKRTHPDTIGVYREDAAFQLFGIDNCAYGGDDQVNTIMTNMVKSQIGYAPEMQLLIRDSLNASCHFPDNYFDFVFLDSSHLYEQTKAEIRLWWRKIKNEGILAGHDYFTAEQVKQAVDEVIPEFVTRPPLDETIFAPTKVLNIEPTDKGYGVWWARKDFFIHLNP